MEPVLLEVERHLVVEGLESDAPDLAKFRDREVADSSVGADLLVASIDRVRTVVADAEELRGPSSLGTQAEEGSPLTPINAPYFKVFFFL